MFQVFKTCVLIFTFATVLDVRAQCWRASGKNKPNIFDEMISLIFGSGPKNSTCPQTYVENSLVSSEKVNDLCYQPCGREFNAHESICSLRSCDSYGKGSGFVDKITHCEKKLDQYFRGDPICLNLVAMHATLNVFNNIFNGFFLSPELTQTKEDLTDRVCCRNEPACKEGYEKGAAECICVKIERFSKVFYERSLVARASCDQKDYVSENGKCRPKCEPGYSYFLNTCIQTCKGFYTFACGLICTEDLRGCIFILIDMIFGVVGLAIDTALSIGSGGSDVGAILGVVGGLQTTTAVFLNDSL